MQGNSDAMSVLCRNLIDNAIRYCPEGGNITLGIIDSEQRVELNLTNHCAPLTYLVGEQLTEPFARGPGEQSSGSGIGLALVQQIVHSSLGTMTLDINEEHFAIIITLPALVTEAEPAR